MTTRKKPGPERAAFLFCAASVLLLAAGPSCTRSQPPADPDATKPAAAARRDDHVNVLIFLIDTLRADRLGVHRYERPTSPRMDALAREAVVFEQAYAPAPWTLPSLVSLLTSTFPCEHGTLHDRQRLSDSLEPIAERFKRLGYTTLGLVGNPFASPAFGLDRGYDLLQHSRENDADTVRRMLDWYPATPFFLYVHNMEPHTPHRFAPAHTDGFRDVPSSIRSKIKERYLAYRRLSRVDFEAERPPGTTDNTAEQNEQMAALAALRDDYSELYDASIRLADTRVGSVIDLLKGRGLWENTLFIVLSDHGEEFDEHGGWLHDQSVYEELLAVPLIIRFPRGEYGGRRVKSVVSLVDVLPTIFDYLQEPDSARGARGRSLMPLIRGDAPDAAEDFVVPAMRINRKKYYRPWKESRGDINIVVRRGGWKGIWNVEPDTLELYNLSSDPREGRELSATQPDLALAMQVFARLWYRDCACQAAEAQDATEEMDEKTLRELRALGYID